MIPLPDLRRFLTLASLLFVGALVVWTSFAAGQASMAHVALRFADDAAYFEAEAIRAWTLYGERTGLSSDEVRYCLGARATP